MATYEQRVQTVLSRETYALLQRLSAEQGKPLSALVREAVEQVYVREAARARREAALHDILELNLPVAGWDEMEEEIIAGAVTDER